MKKVNRIVVKVGTSTLTHDTGLINIRAVERLIKVLSDIKNSGLEVIFVTSGAIGIGAGKLRLAQRPGDTPTKQAAAAVGQLELMHTYDKLFSEYNHTTAQILLTKDITDNDGRRTNVLNTFNRLLELGAIPIINENDTVSVEEIEFGDNDQLSALVAVLTNADMLIVLSDIDGLYDKNPSSNDDAKLIPVVTEITDDIRRIATGAGSRRGTGGMITKLYAAEACVKNGIDMYIINGSSPKLIYDAVNYGDVGTLFRGAKS